MESIAELRQICQTTAKKDVSNVYMRYVSRFFSIYLTRYIFLPLGIGADLVSFAMIVTGSIAAIFLAGESLASLWVGAVLLQLWYVLDCCDGEVARYRFYRTKEEIVKDKMQLAITGSYWDYLNHYIIHGMVPFCLGLGLFQLTFEVRWVIIGFIASLSQTLLLAVHDTKSRGFVGLIRKKTSGNWWAQSRASAPTSQTRKINSPLKKIFIAIHYSCTYPTVMNAVLLAVIAESFYVAGREYFLLFYAPASLVVFLALAAKNLKDQGVDREFDSQFVFRELP